MEPYIFNANEYYSLLLELFNTDQQDGALAKLMKVRHTYEEMELYIDGVIRWEEVKNRTYFRLRYLQPKKGEGFTPIYKIPRKRVLDAMARLRYSVGIPDDENFEPSGCWARCLKLVGEIVEIDKKRGVETIDNFKKLLDCFSYNPRPVGENRDIKFIENDFRRFVYRKIQLARKAGDQDITLFNICKSAWYEFKAKYDIK
ncbi:MAG: hypothetical protein K6G36_03410 [Candidatus Saccharibacteria bacterium]|nr:hypothetical protein [Candidatus Saccharibacteria bacterium]